MKEGVKLYSEFKNLISQVGEVKMAWFTTFNLSLDFFEKYVLSALVKTNPFDLKSLKDFEALNDRLINAKDGEVDVKVFHDFRALRPDVKRTSIQTIGINPSQIDSSYAHGVFHPKVALIVNENNEAWLLTGSANLTIAAWSKNSEGILFKKIEDKKNAQAVTDFFLGILPDERSKLKIETLNKEWQRKFHIESDWNFIHSVSNHKLLDYLQEETCNEMMVWSPYFSDEFVDIIDNHLGWLNRLTVVPDVTASGAIRMSTETIDKTKNCNKANWLKDVRLSEEELLVHAKIWATPTKIAIGSWNFTKAGLNLAHNSNNIEAGIIQEINPDLFDAFKSSCSFIEMDEPKGMLKEEIEDEKQDLLFNWTFNCQIYADWSSYRYRIEFDKDLSQKQLYFDLPGAKSRVSLEDIVKSEVSFHAEHKYLLKDRLFTVYNQKTGGDKVYLGVIIELNPIERPSVGFESINDLLRAWSDRKPENKTQYHQINYHVDTITGEELSDKIAKLLKGDYSNAWFTMFLAFEQMKIRIEEADINQRELSMLGYRIPGSVSQLSDHLLHLKEKIESEEIEMSHAFIWFMINEGNQIIKKFNSKIIGDKYPKVQSVDNINLNFKNIDKSQMNQWLSYIEESCAY